MKILSSFISFIITIQIASAISFFDPFKEVKSIALILDSPDIEKLVKTKFLDIDKEEKVFFEVYYIKPQRIDVAMKGAAKIKDSVRENIEKYFEKKLLNFFESNYHAFLYGYENTKMTKIEKEYIDKSGILPYQEIKITEKGNSNVSLRLKKPLGTHQVEYKTFDIGEHKNVINSVSKSVYEGISTLKMEINIEYENIKDYYLPTKIKGSFNQSMRSSDENFKVTRALDEELSFKIIEVNGPIPLKWFSNKS